MENQHIAELWLLISTLIYFLMNGAQIFETAVIIPKWTANPPDSFAMFKGKYGLDLKTFWIAIHSIHEITFIISIYYCWDFEPARTWLLILFGIHFAVRVWTIGYFAPRIIEFQKIANAGQAPNGLLIKTIKWRRLNYWRVGVFVAVSVGVLVCYLRLMGLL